MLTGKPSISYNRRTGLAQKADVEPTLVMKTIPSLFRNPSSPLLVLLTKSRRDFPLLGFLDFQQVRPLSSWPLGFSIAGHLLLALYPLSSRCNAVVISHDIMN